MKIFENCEVKQVAFSEVKFLHRFFTDNGVGYTKSKESYCYDDYGFVAIYVHPDTLVWIKG